MKVFRAVPAMLVLVLIGLTVLNVRQAPGDDKTLGQKLDDVAIVTEIKAKLAAEKLSTLTKVSVKSDNGIVTLSGTVDSLDRKALAAQIASQVKGVKGIVNKIDVATASAPSSGASSSDATSASATASAHSTVDATGVVARVDEDRGTITLQDGRVLKANEQTAVFQRTKVKDLKPGTQVLVRGAAPAGYQPTASATPPEWVMGTVSRVDTGANQIVLTDGTIVRVTPSTSVHRGADRVALAQLEPGAEIVVRVPSTATTTGSAEGSASPGQTPGARTIEAAEVNVVWMPPTGTR